MSLSIIFFVKRLNCDTVNNFCWNRIWNIHDSSKIKMILLKKKCFAWFDPKHLPMILKPLLRVVLVRSIVPESFYKGWGGGGGGGGEGWEETSDVMGYIRMSNVFPKSQMTSRLSSVNNTFCFSFHTTTLQFISVTHLLAPVPYCPSKHAHLPFLSRFMF